MSEVVSSAPEACASVFESNLPLETKLEHARTELLDLSARNRLLNIPRSAKSVRILEVVDEQSAEIYRLLVREQKAFTFLAGKAAAGSRDAEVDSPDDQIAELAQPDDDGRDERGVALRHADTRLQTRLTPAGLQKRLLDLYYDARTLEEEQGVNILFLALGTLKWVDPNNPANIRHAPLVLIPVALERGNAAEKFKLRWRQEDPAPNLSLEAYLGRVHGMKFPMFEANEDFDIAAYIASVAEAIEGKPDWAVQPDDVVLGFFSFAKFLMYRDLDPQTWPPGSKLSDHDIVRPLLSDGFPGEDLLLDEDAHIDEHIPPREMIHIVDSDSSQTRAVHEVRAGRSLVIQGPPGTGKSQTIANVIASAIADGKTVLFVAEKMAALEVVKRRLDNTGVGDACLELHSNKANKRAVLENLRRTWELGAPRGENLESLTARLAEARDQLNVHAERLHCPIGPAGYTPYELIGHLTRLKQEGQGPSDLRLEGAVTWTADEFQRRRDLLTELAERVVDIGVPAQHLWRGIDLPVALPPDVDRLETRLTALVARLEALLSKASIGAKALQTEEPTSLAGLDDFAAFAARVASAPDLEAEALGSERWSSSSDAIGELLSLGQRHEALRNQLGSLFQEDAWSADLTDVIGTLEALPTEMDAEVLGSLDVILDALPQLAEASERLATKLGRTAQPGTLEEIRQLALVAERVAEAPPADAAAFAADLWDSGVERAGDLAAAVASLEAARAEVGTTLSDAAWSADLTQARQTLGAHGTSLLRLFNGEWRKANRLVQSFLAEPKASLPRRLALLDALARGQAARRLIEAEEGLGRSAFGADWRGERSASAPLLALVEWMRSLKGLGAEPRLVVSRGSDRNAIGALAHDVRRRVEALEPLLQQVWRSVGGSTYAPLGGAASPALCNLAISAGELARLARVEAAYRGLARVPQRTVGERHASLALLAEGQDAAKSLEDNADLGRAAFGTAWKGQASDWQVLRTAATWIADNLDIHRVAAQAPQRVQLAAELDAALPERGQLVAEIEQLLTDVQAQDDAAVRPGYVAESPCGELSRAIGAWCEHTELLSKWVAYQVRAREGERLGVSDVVQRLHTGTLRPEGVIPGFEMAYFEAIFASQVHEAPELLQFDGDLHERTVRSFVDLDRQRIRHAALEVVRAHHRRIPPATGGAAGPLGVLKSEIARKRGHMPIRQLIQKAAPAIQALKPVFMMSPLSVAQFLPPGAITFDLLVMDEASQIQPVDALGAIGRARQVVVVGDPQQLPPTAFFAKMTGGGDADEDDGAANVADIESILGLFTARGLPLRMLRWHYRSRHESLIAVSNRQFYENKLVIIPSPYSQQSGLGLRFHHVEDGIFESGTTRTNPIEAKRVAKAIVEHAIRTPGQSLGVVAFSAAQRRAIVDQLELLRRQLPPEHEAFFQAHPAEPFFVKNLENVQGDERDVILISVGYGPTAPRTKPPMRFGPLGQDGGERRLNVLISRAKRRCEIFSSMTDEDIDPDFAATRKGVFAFKLFLHFARTGRMSLAEAAAQDRDDVFEAQVAQALQARGFQVHRKVGVSGLFVDIAIADPERPDRYILGVELDGPAYRAARSARDRDRLRRSVLEDHGWIVHRIWSTDWFRRPKEQLDRLVTAIEAARVELDARGKAAPQATGGYEILAFERDEVTEIGIVGAAEAGAARAYVEAAPQKPTHLACELHEAPTGVLTAMAELVVQQEGPIHLDEVITRVREAWGLKRAGSRIQDAIFAAIHVAVRQQRLTEERGFYSVPGRPPVVRDRSSARSPGLRRPETLPPSEMAVALLDVIGRNFGATDDQAILAVARALGFKATSSQLRDIIEDVLEDLLVKDVLVRRDTLLQLGPNAPAPTPRQQPLVPLEQLIAEGEHERLEFKQTLRWDVRQQAVNAKLEDVVVKTIAAFTNHQGGTLLIGVTDDGVIEGIEADVRCTGGNRDKFELHLTNLLSGRFSAAFRAAKVKVSFSAHGDQFVCRVDVQRSRTPVYVTLPDQSGAKAERLFVRVGNASHEIPPSQIVAFVREHFDHA